MIIYMYYINSNLLLLSESVQIKDENRFTTSSHKSKSVPCFLLQFLLYITKHFKLNIYRMLYKLFFFFIIITLTIAIIKIINFYSRSSSSYRSSKSERKHYYS